MIDPLFPTIARHLGRGAMIALLLAVAPMATAQPAPKPDPARGQVLAQRLCSNCHEVGTQPSAAARVEPPSFRAIAGRGYTAEALAGKIIIPHPEMPAVPITLGEIRDLIAYIQSVKD
jgi:cytochrome c